MVDSYLRQSPLTHLGLGSRALADRDRTGAGVRLCEHAFRGQIVVRGNARSKPFRDAVEGAVGCIPPRTPNTVEGGSDLVEGNRILWLSPDEWLVVTAPGREHDAVAALREALASHHAAVADVSESRVVIGLSGGNARETLMKGCAIDLHPRAFAAGQCAQTSLARAHMILHQIDDAPAYEIYVHRSFGEYAWAWLEDAAGEYGVQVIEG
jgi:sarcosine oxidase subunit gamma